MKTVIKETQTPIPKPTEIAKVLGYGQGLLWNLEIGRSSRHLSFVK